MQPWNVPFFIEAIGWLGKQPWSYQLLQSQDFLRDYKTNTDISLQTYHPLGVINLEYDDVVDGSGLAGDAMRNGHINSWILFLENHGRYKIIQHNANKWK